MLKSNNSVKDNIMKKWMEPFNKFCEKYEKTLGLTLHAIEIVVIVGGVYLALVQIRDLRKVNAGQIALDITRDIYTDERYANNPKIIKLMQLNEPILKVNGGPMSEADLDNILGEYEFIARLNDIGVLPNDLVSQQFSFNLIKAWKSKEIQRYIEHIRKAYKNENLFADFEWLAEKMEDFNNVK
jgi:hypothetical protein